MTPPIGVLCLVTSSVRVVFSSVVTSFIRVVPEIAVTVLELLILSLVLGVAMDVALEISVIAVALEVFMLSVV